VNIVKKIRNQRHGEIIAIREGEMTLSFDQLFDSVDSLKQQLLEHDCFVKQDLPRIGVHFPNGLAYIIVALAVIDSGACFVPIPDELTEKERTNLIEDTALHGIISIGSSCSESSSIDITLPLHLGSATITSLEQIIPKFPVNLFEEIEPAFIRFSSGTTSSSKGVVLSHSSLFERIIAANQGLELQPGDSVLWTLPMAHHFAVSIILYLYIGATTVIETLHEPKAIYNAAKASKTNLLYGSPFHFAQLAQYKEAAPLPHLRLAISTASRLSEEIAKAFKKRFDLPLTQALGIIEIGLPILNKEHAHDTPEALGQALPAYQTRIDSPENGIGELLIKGPGMFDAYLLPWQTRRALTSDGWFSTGDLIENLKGNTLIMRGRNKSVINIGGMKVFPEEIEAILDKHPAVEKSRVFAKTHPTLGAFPCAEYLLLPCANTPGLMDLRDHCAEFLSPYKVPLQIQLVKELALTANGKIKRH